MNMTDSDENITELADAQTRRRNAAIAKFNKRRHDIGLQMTAPYYGRQIPPPLNPCYPGWVALLTDGYKELSDQVARFNQTILRLVSARKLDPTAGQELRRHFDEFRRVIADAAVVIDDWSPTEDPEDTIPPEVHRIADYGKYVYAIGSRDISWMQHRLKKLAYSGLIDIEAQNELHHDLCYSLGEPIYSATTSLLHDHATWDGGWDWDENTYSDGRQVMIRVRITDWQTLFGEVTCNFAITGYGDGVINEHPEGMVCLINSPVPGNAHECGHPVVEISLEDLKRQPWIHARWDVVRAAEQAHREEEQRLQRETAYRQAEARRQQAEKFREEI
jgi:hypothetical protein